MIAVARLRRLSPEVGSGEILMRPAPFGVAREKAASMTKTDRTERGRVVANSVDRRVGESLNCRAHGKVKQNRRCCA
jgi:hypothetical protein